MKALKTLIATGATLAFMAPAAHATFDSVAAPHAKAKAAKVVKVVKAHKTAKASHRAIIVANNGGDRTDASSSGPNYGSGDGPLYIIWTSPLGSPQPVADTDCESTGNDCTPAELCSYWGENCDQAYSSMPDVQSTEDQTPAG